MPIDLKSLRNILNASDIGQTNPTLYKLLDGILSNQLYGDGQYITNIQSENIVNTIPSGLLSDYKFVQRLINDITTYDNSGTGETTFYSYDLTADLLNTNKSSLRGLTFGTWANNANNKTLKLKFDGNTFLTLGPFAPNAGGSFYIDFTITRLTSSTARTRCMTITKSTTAGVVVPISSDVADLTGISFPTKLNLSMTGQSDTASNDVTAKFFGVDYLPEPLL